MITLKPPEENIFKQLSRFLFARPILEIYPDNSILFTYHWINGRRDEFMVLEDLPMPEILIVPPGCRIVEEPGPSPFYNVEGLDSE